MTHSSLWPLLAVVPQCNGWFQSPSNHYLNTQKIFEHGTFWILELNWWWVAVWYCIQNKRQKKTMIKLLVCWSKLSDAIEEMQNKLLKIVVGLSGRNDPFECKCPFCFRSYQTQDQFGQYHIVFNYICFLSFVLCLFYISGLFWYFSSSFFSTILSDSILFVLINVT